MSSELAIGTTLDTAEPAVLNASRLNRHTFWCGQSGSGKTYALGVMLEQVLLQTKLPIVVLDPNSDFVRLKQVRDSVSAGLQSELSQRDIRVLRPGATEDRLCVRFFDLSVRTQAAIMRLDPVLDAEQYNTMLQIDANDVAAIEQPLNEWLRASENPAFRDIALCIENLGVLDWDLWAYADRDVTDVLNDRADATVVDLGGFDQAEQMQTVALAVLDELWANRHQRTGRLVVIDEAHNLCPPHASTPLEQLLTERIIQIAAEGRKYGIWLLLSTQRPSKVHPNVISQCDNLALMKMSSRTDLTDLAQIFGFAPEHLIEQSSSFSQGQALFAGGFASQPQLVQMGDRLTQEGGSDVAIELR